MRHEEETSTPNSLWRRLLADWLSEDGQVGETDPQAAKEQPEARDDLAA